MKNNITHRRALVENPIAENVIEPSNEIPTIVNEKIVVDGITLNKRSYGVVDNAVELGKYQVSDFAIANLLADGVINKLNEVTFYIPSPTNFDASAFAEKLSAALSAAQSVEKE